MQQHSPSKPPDATWTLTDGHAGNVRQARALAAALGRNAWEWTLEARAPWRWLAPRRWPDAGRAFGDGFANALEKPPRLAIGCGRQAALATRLLRSRGAHAVQILDPRIDPSHWDVVIAPEHDRVRGDNVITLLGSLNPVDDLWLAAARSEFAAIGQLPGPRTALLVGGASAHVAFDDAAIEAMALRVEAIARREGGSVLATASRRTPATARARLRARFAAAPHLVWSGDDDGANPYPGLLGWADRIVCTADSVNMLSEAAATNAPVFVAGLDAVSGRPRRFLDSLLARGRIRRFGDDDGDLARFEVTALRETSRVAAQVRVRIGLLP
ncbi:mitochondrial fission ELM1 family protein [Lysobacter koreensis]|uniref:Mitochondrial fission ELM1 family protein n=1 Tax=Lysobacter koreensis TaxID=266122 RepID=A0ABW2YNR1_9GAMM